MTAACRASVLIIFIFIEQWLIADEWLKAESAEAASLVDAANSALITHWESTHAGWCRAITENGKYAVELCWDRAGRTGLRAWSVDGSVDHDLWNSRPPRVVACYSRKEQWIYDSNNKILFGYDDYQSRNINAFYDCRQHTTWLGGGEETVMDYFKEMKDNESLDVQTSKTGRVRFITDDALLEFDVSKNFSPVLLQCQMDMNRFKVRELALPRQYQWNVVQDSNGVWYSNHTTSTWYGRGFENETNPIVTVIEVVDYDSTPPPEKMRLDYKTIDIPSGAKVISKIPKKSGQWLYGSDGSAAKKHDQEIFRDVGQKMRLRGFAKRGDEVP